MGKWLTRATWVLRGSESVLNGCLTQIPANVEPHLERVISLPLVQFGFETYANPFAHDF
jgi:hypothetical protein